MTVMRKRMGNAPRIIHFDGMSMTPLEWADYLGISRSRLYNRLRAWPLAEALRRDKQNGHGKLKGERIPVSQHEARGGPNTSENA